MPNCVNLDHPCIANVMLPRDRRQFVIDRKKHRHGLRRMKGCTTLMAILSTGVHTTLGAIHRYTLEHRCELFASKPIDRFAKTRPHLYLSAMPSSSDCKNVANGNFHLSPASRQIIQSRITFEPALRTVLAVDGCNVVCGYIELQSRLTTRRPSGQRIQPDSHRDACVLTIERPALSQTLPKRLNNLRAPSKAGTKDTSALKWNSNPLQSRTLNHERFAGYRSWSILGGTV